MSSWALAAWEEREAFATDLMAEVEAMPVVDARKFAAAEPADAPTWDVVELDYDPPQGACVDWIGVPPTVEEILDAKAAAVHELLVRGGIINGTKVKL